MALLFQGPGLGCTGLVTLRQSGPSGPLALCLLPFLMLDDTFQKVAGKRPALLPP